MAEFLAFAPWRSPRSQDATRAQQPAEAEAAARPPRAIRWALTALVVGLVMTDRFGIAIGTASLGASLPLTYVLLTVLLLAGWLVVDTLSLVLYGGIVSVVVSSLLINVNIDGGNRASIASMFLLLAIYLPFVFSLPQRPDNPAHWRWLMGVFSNVLLIAAVAGILQFYAQFVYRAPWLFDLSVLIPEPIRGQGVYNSSISTGSVLKANGIFSREPSGFSYLMAFGLLIELALFKRVKRMLGFGLALLLSYSGTGLLALAIGLFLPLRRKLLVRLAIGAALVLAGNMLADDPLNLAFTLSRAGEFGAKGSSGYARYVAPFYLVDANIDATPWSTWLGHGSGMILKVSGAFDAHDPTWAKLLFEYGIVGFRALRRLRGLQARGVQGAVPVLRGAVRQLARDGREPAQPRERLLHVCRARAVAQACVGWV